MKSTKVAWLILLLASTAGVAQAQGVGASGEIHGAVLDPQGAVIPKATVTATEAERGIRRTAVTDSSGQYYLVGLLPATYDVSAEIQGFQTEIQKGVTVSVGQVTVVDFHLKISKTSSTVEVTAEAPAVNIEQAQQANSISERYITDLPINRRDYLTFTLLAPAVSNSTRLASDQDFRVKQTPQSGLSFYGSNGRGNSVTVDGGEANDDAGGVRLTMSQDAVQEFQINRSNYAADLGGASGATINIVTRSGSNDLHGSLFGFFRNDGLDARDPFAFTQALAPNVPFNPSGPDSKGSPIKNSLNRQQFGGSTGFPIAKAKTFLFLGFEGLRQDAQNSVPILTNTNIFRPESDAANNQVALLNAIASIPGNPMVPCITKPLTFLPAQTCARALGSGLTISQFTGLTPQQAMINQFIVGQFEANGGLFNYNTRTYLASVRLDHEFGAKDHAYLRYSYGYDDEQNPDVQSLTGFTRGSKVHANDNTILGKWFHIFSPTFQNEARLQFNYADFNVIPNIPGQVGLDIPGFANVGTQIFLPSLTIMRRYEAADNITLIRGRHTMKFGGQFLERGNHSESHTFFPGRFVFGALPGGLLSPCFLPSSSMPNPCGLTTAGVNINSIQSVSLAAPQFFEQGFGNPNYNYPRPFGAFFWQDSWQILPNFTLNYGLRYEIDGQYGPLQTDKDNFAPRLSFAWDPFKDHKTVVRGGFGIFYSPIYGQIADVVQTLGNVNNTRQIANILVPLTGDPLNPAVTSQSIFGGLFFNPSQNLISCTKPAPGNAACITPAALAPLGVTVSNTGPLPPLTVIFSGQPGYQSPYSEQGEFGIEREIGAGFVVSASYIYVHTLRLPVAIDINALPAPFVHVPLANGGMATYRDWNVNPALDPFGGAPCQGAMIVKCFAKPLILQADQYSSQASSVFQGGILEMKRRFSNHFTLFGNYTFSKAFDTTTDFNSDFGPQDNTALGLERALSTFDQRHKVVIAGVFDSPWRNPAIAGFELSPIVTYTSGHPFNLLAVTDINGDRHFTNDRPIGAGRNTGLGPNFVTFDMRLSRTFRFGERYSVQLLAEGFNLANRTNFASVNNVVGPVFGLPKALGGGGATTFNVHGTSNQSPSQPLGFTSDFPKRQIQLGVQFRF